MEDQDNSQKTLRTSEILILTAILLTGLFLRISYLSENVKSPDFKFPMVDAAYHDYWARGLVSGDWTPPANTNNPKLRNSPYIRPPGYPYFLAFVYLLTGSSFLVVRIVQMALGLVNSLLAYILGRSLFGRAVGLILAGLMSVYWVFIFFEGELLAPVLIILCALSLINILRLWTTKLTYLHSISAGVICGLFALVRPNILLFAPFVLVWAWWLTRRNTDNRTFRTAAAGFLISIAAVIAPVTLRNYLVADDFVLISSNAGVNLYIGNNEKSNGVFPVIPDLQELSGMNKWDCFDYPQIVRGVSRTEGRPMKYSEVSSFFAKKAIHYIRKHPLKTLKLTARKAALYWGPAEVCNNKEIICAKQQSATLRHIPGFALVLSSAVAGLLQLIFNLKIWRIKKEPLNPKARKQFEVSVLILLFIGTYFISYLPFFVAARYRVPIIPFLLLFGAYGIHSIGQHLRGRDFRRTVCWAFAWVILYALATRQLVPYTGYPTRWHFYRGAAFLANKQTDLAIKEYKKALQIAPNFAWAHYYLAMAFELKGNLSEAAEYYYSALQIKPDFVTARYKLGTLLYQQGKTGEAVNDLIKVIQLNPYHVSTHNYLGLAFYKLGNTDDAVKHWTQAIDLEPEWAEPYNNLAWLLATVKDEKLRNPTKAVRLAERACEITNHNQPEMLDTLAVAYAAEGRFKKAVKTAEKGIERARKTRQEKLAEDIQSRLELYKVNKPYQ